MKIHLGGPTVHAPRSVVSGLVASILVAAAILGSIPVFGQPAALDSSALDQLVARIALYPDPLLAQILTASSYWNEIPEAAAWADQHSYFKGDALANAIKADNLQWDPSLLALLPFPSVLDMMARDMAWTQQLGNAVLTQRGAVMDAVQRMRRKAMDNGYLQSNNYENVRADSGYIQILPVDPGLIYVPSYDPLIVFSRPAIAGAIHFGPGITIGAAFAPWGWASAGFLWPSGTIVFDRHPWGRVWVNRGVYVHPYAHPWIRAAGPRVEHHEIGMR